MPETVPPSDEPDAAVTTGTGSERSGATAPPADSPLDVSGSGTPGDDAPPQSPSGT